MKKEIEKLSMVRLGSNKIYIGGFKDGKCSGKSIIIMKNDDIN